MAGIKYGKLSQLKPAGQLKLTVKTIETITEALKRGHFANTACACAGISYSSFTEWMRRGKKEFEHLTSLAEAGTKLKKRDYSIFFYLYIGIQHAVAESQETPLKSINAAAEAGDWRAAAHFLERRFNRNWGHKTEQKVEQTGNPVSQTIIVMPENIKTVEDWNTQIAEKVKLNDTTDIDIDDE